MIRPEDQIWMKRCLDLASSRTGYTYPNPLVGSVIVSIEGQWIAEGRHERAGEPHAERMALAAVPKGTDLEGATLYVNLEPCAHHGRTPPCAHAIAETPIKRVVIAHRDPNPLVAGKGIAHLESQGVEVVCGVLELEARWLTRRFLCAMEYQRPYIVLKWAQCRNGYVDHLRSHGTAEDASLGTAREISGRRAQLYTHRWRAEEQAIFVGYRTALLDNPRLDVRHWEGESPRIVVWDPKGQLPPSLRIFERNDTLHLTEEDLPDGLPSIAHQLTHILYQKGIQSVFIEGGPATHQLFLEAKLWDECRIFTSNSVGLEHGVRAALPPCPPSELQNLDTDTLTLYKNTRA